MNENAEVVLEEVLAEFVKKSMWSNYKESDWQKLFAAMHASSKQIMSKMRKQVSSIEILEIDKQELTRLQNNKLDEIEQLKARLKAFEDSNEDLSKKSFEYDLILPQFEELSVNATKQLLRIDELREEERKLKEDVRKATAKIE